MSSLALEQAPNPWVSVDYVRDNSETILAATREHVVLTLVSVGLGLLLAVPLALLARRVRVLRGPVLGLAGVVYTIPSLALFAVLVPFTGLTSTTVVIGLTGYTLLVLVRNVLAGLDGVPADVREAARGTGMTPGQVLRRVDLPLALPTVLAGVRIATVSTIALVTVGVIVGRGGLGQLIFAGFNNNLYRAQILTASLLCVLLALVADLLLVGARAAAHPVGAPVSVLGDTVDFLSDPASWEGPGGIPARLAEHVAVSAVGRRDRGADRPAAGVPAGPHRPRRLAGAGAVERLARRADLRRADPAGRDARRLRRPRDRRRAGAVRHPAAADERARRRPRRRPRRQARRPAGWA